MDEVELRELRYFIAVAEELNFTRAAARLGMTQPPLSAAIAKLERQLGVRLLDRTSRRVTLTSAGAVLLEHGRIAIETAAAAIERARRAGTQPARLTLAVKPNAGTELIRQIVRRCAQDQQIPEVRILFGHPGGPAAAVRSGAADVAVLRTPFDSRGLDTELLLTEPRVAVLPAGHPLATRPQLRRADLTGQPMPHWAGPPDPVAAAYWTGTDTPGTGTGSRHRHRRIDPHRTTGRPRDQRHQPAPGRRPPRRRGRLRPRLGRDPEFLRRPGLRPGHRPQPQRGCRRLARRQPLPRHRRLRPRRHRSRRHRSRRHRNRRYRDRRRRDPRQPAPTRPSRLYWYGSACSVNSSA